jgi:hypothetical protein
MKLHRFQNMCGMTRKPLLGKAVRGTLLTLYKVISVTIL